DVQNAAPEVNANLALMALRNGDTANAETYLAKANGASTYNEVLGCLNIAKGNYAQAASSLAGTNTNSQALAEILNNDYASAANTLQNVQNADATTSYLKAVLAARTNDASGVASNLQAVAQQDSALAARAKDDLEFENYSSAVNQ
ncbi:MAG: hypothetical protein LUC44_07165, partial [Prevotellaceae bacterium]|nr:hypothetical protein [Prevotellaceae bacterium]